MFNRIRSWLFIGLSASLVSAACGGSSGAPPAPTAVSTSPTPQPALTPSAALPTFSDPTRITHPFFPVSSIERAIELGTEGGVAYRTEVTLLPETKIIEWPGGKTEVLVSQYVAYAEGKLIEIAYDYFAQADDGSVYYFGEDVTNFEGGQVANHDGSWLAGKGGAPPAVIMPAQPTVGMRFNPENLPGVVYETDEVISASEATTTPAGPISDGLLIKETLMDGSIEYKVYATGWGIVEERAEDARVNLVLATRTDATPGSVPDSLQTVKARAEDIIDHVVNDDWANVSAGVAAVVEAWAVYQPQAVAAGAPQAFQDELTSALARLQTAAGAKDAVNTLQAANDLSAAAIDLFDVYQPAVPADLKRLGALERQVVIDTTAEDFVAAAESLAKANAVWARIKSTVLAHNGADVAGQFDASLETQAGALAAEDVTALTAEAENGLELVDLLEKIF